MFSSKKLLRTHVDCRGVKKEPQLSQNKSSKNKSETRPTQSTDWETKIKLKKQPPYLAQKVAKNIQVPKNVAGLRNY